MLADLPDSLWTLFAVVTFFFPLLHVAISKRAQGMEVVGWLILVLVSSYLGRISAGRSI